MYKFKNNTPKKVKIYYNYKIIIKYFKKSRPFSVILKKPSL